MKNYGLSQNFRLVLLGFFMVIVAIALFAYSSPANNISHLETSRNLPDLSGLAWLKEDNFLAVHDSKSVDVHQPRVSLITLPQSSKGLEWRPLNINWQSVDGVAMDLESITPIPDTNFFILAESSHYQKHRGCLLYTSPSPRDRG